MGRSPRAAVGRGADFLRLSQSRLDDGRCRLRAEQCARSGAARADPAPLPADLEIAGPIKLTLYASSTRNDMDFFVKLSEQMPQSAEDRGKGINPASCWITKGWLRASHRALDADKSTEMEPYHSHAEPQPIEPGKVYRFDISIEHM